LIAHWATKTTSVRVNAIDAIVLEAAGYPSNDVNAICFTEGVEDFDSISLSLANHAFVTAHRPIDKGTRASLLKLWRIVNVEPHCFRRNEGQLVIPAELSQVLVAEDRRVLAKLLAVHLDSRWCDMRTIRRFSRDAGPEIALSGEARAEDPASRRLNIAYIEMKWHINHKSITKVMMYRPLTPSTGE
jgi:hypothetical protein